MASLEEIKTYLNMDLINKRIRDGKKNLLKNRYYYYRNKYYIVELSQNMWTILEDYNNKTFIRNLCVVCTK